MTSTKYPSTLPNFNFCMFLPKNIFRFVEYINVMTYDFNSASSDDKTGQNSPLYPSSSDSNWARNNGNCDVAINNWLNSGNDPRKLVLGMGFYGQSFELADSNQHGISTPIVGPGIGNCTITYAEVKNQ